MHVKKLKDETRRMLTMILTENFCFVCSAIRYRTPKTLNWNVMIWCRCMTEKFGIMTSFDGSLDFSWFSPEQGKWLHIMYCFMYIISSLLTIRQTATIGWIQINRNISICALTTLNLILLFFKLKIWFLFYV